MFFEVVLPVVLFSAFTLGETVRFPWLHTFASIGDSYAAGLGAGDRLDWACSRYGSAYPYLLHDSYLGSQTERRHQSLACSGATAKDVLEKQVPQLPANIDLLTISAGGNDAGMGGILNNCVYQFSPDGDCDTTINETLQRIGHRGQVYSNVTLLLEAVKPKLNKTHGVVYVTGYAPFFGTDGHDCDKVTWAVWRDGKPESKRFLSLAMRMKFNDMVTAVNALLRDATKAAGPQFRFMDYSQHIRDVRGRYCESGIHEPDPNREGLSFYEWNTMDSGPNTTAIEQTGDDVSRGSFEAQIAQRIAETLSEHPEWEFDPKRGFLNKSKIESDGVIGDIVWWLLPDSWKRVFHPRPAIHAFIAQMIVDDLSRKEEQRVLRFALLVYFAIATLVAIGLVMVLVALWGRQRAVRSAAAWHQTEDPYSDDDAATLAEPSEHMTATIKGYHTFE